MQKEREFVSEKKKLKDKLFEAFLMRFAFPRAYAGRPASGKLE